MTMTNKFTVREWPTYYIETQLTYLDHMNNYTPKHINKTFYGAQKEDTLSNIQYYCIKFGMADVKMLFEGTTTPQEYHNKIGTPPDEEANN